MNLRTVAVRLSRALARGGMNALLDPERRGTSSTRRRADATVGPDGRRAGAPTSHRHDDAPNARPAGSAHPYGGDWTAPLPATAYAPHDDGHPDPGEVVWAWVPYEEDHSQGKDRPVLVIARHPELEDVVLALPLTSKDHDRDAAQEAQAGRHWMDVGSGAWDNRGRHSEVRLDRVLQLDVTRVRREGSHIDEQTFDAVIAAARTRSVGR
ncbi:type II toxin-antitoxin system PemK/MazF family toxin [Dermacoccus nishinomiyaensis]|uniref:type II toxin-antitoxin system PemK/MazF family toxin n=1 Tax=Dermacoccus nishinomiyaensis TaxID=1274 RepID=UPI00248DB612|nr:type II toxin-antitoxin system PemK/MazF family toxin [Dermacoccus nishinomiyaensis]